MSKQINISKKMGTKLIFFSVAISLIIGVIIALGMVDLRPKSELLSKPADLTIFK